MAQMNIISRILWLHSISYFLRLFTWTSPIRTLITVPFEAASASSSAFCFSFKSSCIGLISSDRSGGVYLLVPNLEKNHFLIYSLAVRDWPLNNMDKLTITTAFPLPAHWDWTTNHSISYFRNKKSIQRSFLYSFLDCRLLKNIWRTCTRGNIACNFCIHSFTHEITWTFPKDI